MKKYQNETAMRHRQDSVTDSNAISRKIDIPPLFPIHRARHLSAAASVVVSDPLDVFYILRRHLCCRC